MPQHLFGVLVLISVASLVACTSSTDDGASGTTGTGATDGSGSGSGSGGVGATSAGGGTGGSSVSSGDGTATLCWDANTENDLAGYRVYSGTAPGAYDTSLPVGLTPTPVAPCTTMAGLATGTHYFAVTAYDASGNESPYSNEVSKDIL
jgi:fibronectin type 3 domain-containing protein